MTKDDFVQAVQRNNQRLFLIALSFTKSRYDSEDIIQNVFLKLWKYQKSFCDNEHMDKWLTVVCVNESKNYIKSPFRLHKDTEECALASAADFDNAAQMDLYNAVMSLSQKERTVIHLFYYENLPIKDIAKLLKIKESAVKTRLSRARVNLKNKLGDEWTDE